MTRLVRLVPVLAALLLLGSVGSASGAVSAPTGLHGFLLRADEQQTTTFHTTPSFAWNPVPLALHYQFQLSLGTTFHDNSVLYADSSLTTPVAAPGLALPWITGNPHALYARVRAVTAEGTGPWSAPYGFDVVPPATPTPVASSPGLLRWTPVEGAAAYQVWLVDAGKKEIVLTNVLDERELYTFHETPAWTGTVRWRVRAIRGDFGQLQAGASTGAGPRLNGVPAAQFGAWSPIYVSTNPAVTSGPLKLTGTLSDVFCPASPTGAGCTTAHRLMPGFLWSGNEGLDGTPQELFRVYVFTDRECLNPVFTSAIVGSPAYAPRPFGPLSLPTSGAGIATARTTYLGDGSEPASYTYDGTAVSPTESQPDAKPTTSAPPAPGDTDGTPSSSASSGSGGGGGTITVGGETGAPIDLWDVDWPQSGYYWTVVPVSAQAPGALTTNVAGAGADIDATSLPVASAAGFNPGDTIEIGSGPTAESATITGISGNTLTLAAKLANGHGPGEIVVRSGGSLVYHDTELPQDACAAGRIARFGTSSEPSLTASGDAFATGLSATGRLTSAVHATAFHGAPLVAWTTALGAWAYELQWSKTQYPFVPEATPGGQLGAMTFATSYVLPLTTGTWWYRVRGFDYSLPTGAQQMTWSDPQKIVVSAGVFRVTKTGGTRFKVVGGKKKAKARAKTAPKRTSAPAALQTVGGPGFSIGVPAGWRPCSKGGLISYCDPTKRMFVGVELESQPYQQVAALLLQTLRSGGVAGATTSETSVPAGKAVVLTATQKSGGHVTHKLAYAVAGTATTSWFVFVQARDGTYAANRSVFGRVIASFRVG